MKTNIKESSFKFHKSSLLSNNELSPLHNSVGGRYNKGISNQKQNNNINILKRDLNQNDKNLSINSTLEKILSNNNIKRIRNNLPNEEKKIIKNSISSNNCIVSNKKQGTIINPLFKNKSNNKIYISNGSKTQNKNINFNNLNNVQKTYFYSNINNIINNTNPNIDSKYNRSSYQSSYIGTRNNNIDIENKYKVRFQSLSKPHETQNYNQSKYQNRTLSIDNRKSELKQSQSQLPLYN